MPTDHSPFDDSVAAISESAWQRTAGPFATITGAILIVCSLGHEANASDRTLYFEVENGLMYANGVTRERSLRDFRRLADRHPEIDVLVFEEVPGSADDEINLELGLEIRKRGFRTVVLSDSFIASGGVDLFLAGQERAVECGAELGVHSWAASDGTQGDDVPRSSAEHAPYLDYYDRLGIPADFYWYTLKAAAPDDLHIMTDAEISTYRVATVARSC